jgi:ketosteroid isomerase-like protein
MSLRFGRSWAITLLIGIVAAGCGRPPALVTGPTIDQAPVTAAMQRLARALEAGDSEAFAGGITDDATIQPPTGSVVAGRAQVRGWVESLPPRVRVSLSNIQSAASADLGYGQATYEVVFRSGHVLRGRVLVAMRQEAQAWRVAVISVNEDQLATVPTTPGAVANDRTPGQEIAIAVAGAFIVWLLVQTVAFYVVRRRLLSFLLVQINSRLTDAPRNLQWFKDLSGRHTPGAVPDDQPNYLRDDAEDIREVRDLLLRYLWTSETQRLTRFLSELRTVEFLFEGVSRTAGQAAVRAATSTGYVVSPAISENIAARVAMAGEVVDRWRSPIARISDLPL